MNMRNPYLSMSIEQVKTDAIHGVSAARRALAERDPAAAAGNRHRHRASRSQPQGVRAAGAGGRSYGRISQEPEAKEEESRQMKSTEQQTLIEPLLLNAAQTARLLGISRSKIYAMHSAGLLPLPVSLGGCVRWDRRELQAWLSARNPQTGLLPNRQQWVEMQAQKDF